MKKPTKVDAAEPRPDGNFQTRLLRHIQKLPHARATYKQLVKELHLTGENREELESVLDRLCSKGELIELRSGHFIGVGGSAEYTVGRVSIHRDGFGFLIPDKPLPNVSGDVFLPPGEAAKLMHGDRAVVHIVRMGGGQGRAEGEVTKIIRRAHITVVGEFRIQRRGNYVIPADDRIQQWLAIPEGMELPAVQESADRVGMAQRRVSTIEDLDGMIVNAEVLEFPEGGEHGVGRVIEILGLPGDFGVDVEIMIRKHHLPHEFAPAVLEEARAISSSIAEEELLRREDFRALDIVTIDGETARDFDDAVWVEQQPDGHFELQVHIADVSHYVKPGSAIDTEAAMRGTSVYFPDRAVPMLPVELSTDICSLRPQEDRLVLSAVLKIDPAGEVVGRRFARGVIRSAERMTYTAVHRLLDGDSAMRERYQKLVPRFELMRDLALILNRKRVKRGSIDFDLPESNIQLDTEGQMVGVTRGERNIAHRIIEEFMLAANEAVASHLETAGIPSLYRIHERPEGKRVLEFEQIAAHFGYSLGIGSLPVKRHPIMERRRDGRKVRKDIFMASESFDISSRNYQKLIAKVAGKPEERILTYLMLRSLKQARYSVVNEGHFALAAPSYTHFTSPIRRYPDLIVHRILAHQFAGQQVGKKGELLEFQTLKEIGDDTSFTERRAAEAERELLEWKKVKFMQDRVGDEFDALIISTAKFGFFVELTDLFVEGLVPIDTLPGDRYQFYENTRQIIGERNQRCYAIGAKVRVFLDRADTVERKLNFAIVEPESSGRKKKNKYRPT